MSFARFGCDGSDVYVYEHYLGFIECCMCSLEDGNSFGAKTYTGMIEHLEEHIQAGHSIPNYLIPNLREEREEHGDAVVEEDW